MTDSAKSHDIQGALEDVAELEEKLDLMHEQNAGVIARNMELDEQIKAKDDYITKLQLRLMRIEVVAEAVHNAFKPGARLPHEQTKALTDLAIAIREQQPDHVHVHVDGPIRADFKGRSGLLDAIERLNDALERKEAEVEELRLAKDANIERADAGWAEVERLRAALAAADNEKARLRAEVERERMRRDRAYEQVKRLRERNANLEIGPPVSLEVHHDEHHREVERLKDPLHRDDPAMDTRGKMA